MIMDSLFIDKRFVRTNTISVYLLVCGDPKEEKYKKKKKIFTSNYK